MAKRKKKNLIIISEEDLKRLDRAAEYLAEAFDEIGSDDSAVIELVGKADDELFRVRSRAYKEKI